MVASDTVGERRLGWIYAVLGAAAIVEYFELIGVDDPRVVAARRRLASALY